MLKILFVCHGNICRSPMAEFVFRDMITKRGLDQKIQVASAATSTEELGNPVHYGTRNKLAEVGIHTGGKFSVLLKKDDYQIYDYFIGMERINIKNMEHILGEDTGHKIYRFLDFTDNPRDIPDPWYSGDFERTYQEVMEGSEAFYAMLCEKHRELFDE